MGIRAQYFFLDVRFKPVHHGQYDNEGHYPEKDPGNGNDGNNGDEELFSLGL